MVEYHEEDQAGPVGEADEQATAAIDEQMTPEVSADAGSAEPASPADDARPDDAAQSAEPTPVPESGPSDESADEEDSAAESEAAVETPADAEVETANNNVADKGASDDDATRDDASGDTASEGDASTDDAAHDAAPESAAPARPAGFPEVITTTTLFFVAPDLPPLPERTRGGSTPEPHDADDDRHHDDAHDDGRGRRRGRGPRNRRGGAPQHEPRTDDRGSREDDGDAQADGGSGGASSGSSARQQRRAPEPITEPQKIKGSTRLEAKRQRRREGRDIGRRRTVVTESEFLARRESVDRSMLVRAKDGRVQIGVLEDRVLVEHYVARSSESSIIGNVYLGRVQNVLPSMEAAFIDIGRGRNAVLYSGEVDWAAAELGNGQARRIENALKPGDKVLVQVTKDPVGHKGARLTSQVSLPGRYLVYVPGNAMNGISRKLPDTERARLKKILKEVLPEGVGVIVRTAAEGATHEQLERDVSRLTAQWEDIRRRVDKGAAPVLLHSEPDLLIKIIRDVFNEDFQRIVIQGREELQIITAYLEQVAPDLVERVEAFEGDDVFTTHRATEFIEKALDRKVWLPSGGSLVIDRTEAMTVVDVNTGKFVGSGGNLEETVTKNNLEAAEEVVRQLRLRDIGGIIVIDFIDMVLESNRDLVLRRLVECLSRDRTKHQVAEVTSLGLVQMTRKKIGLGLLETFSEPCATCAGRGVIVHHDPVAKHRSDDAPVGRGRRGRGGGGGNNDRSGGASNSGGGNTNGNSTGTGTHAITDEARGALSRIAASTLKTDGDAVADAPATEAATDTASATPEPQGQQSGSDDNGEKQGEGRSRRSRRGRRRGRGGNSGAEGNSGASGDASNGDDAAKAGSGDDTQNGAGDVLGIELPEPRDTRPETRPDAAALNALLDEIGGAGLAATTDDEPGSASAEAAEVEPEAVPVEAEEPEAAADATVAASEEPGSAEAPVEPATPVVEASEAPEPRGASGRPKRRRITVTLDDA